MSDRATLEQSTSTCALCPKACRFSCPVSEATHSESLSAWGKMTAAHAVTTGRLPIDADASQAVHACTGCARCTALCKHENDVTTTLFATRGAAVKAGLQPKGAASTLATFHQAQNPFGRELGSLVASWRAQRPVRYPLFPGCSTLVKRPGLLEQTLAVSDAFGAPMGVARSASKCCGYPLFAAGAFDAFEAHARSVAEAFVETPEIAVLDAGCAYTFRVLYPRFGVTVPSRVRTVIEEIGRAHV
jgi:Fe-S oxidoreductase